MSTVEKVLPEIRELIAHLQGQGVNEMNTRASLINPMLNALGWRVGDLRQVHLEFRYQPSDNPVDYALMEGEKPSLFVEAKALGKNLDDPKLAGQIMGYASVAGVDWVVLTDGNEYRIYKAHASVPIDQKLFRTIRLTDDDDGVAEILGLLSPEGLQERRLEQYWQAQFVDRQVAIILEGLFDPEPDKLFVNWLVRRTTDLKQREVADSLRRVRVEFEFPSVPGSEPDPPPPPLPPPITSGNELKLLISARLIRPPFELHRTTLGKSLSARIETDGSVTFQEKRFRSLSMAGRAARIAAGFRGKNSNTNGWDFWRFIDADGEVRKIDFLRKRLRARGEPEGS